MNPFSFCLSGKLSFNSECQLCRINYSRLQVPFFPTIPSWPVKLLMRNQLISLIVFPLYATCFPLVSFKIVCLPLTYAILTRICFGVGLFGFIFFGTLHASQNWISVSFPGLGKFSAVISFNKFSVTFSLLILGSLQCECLSA